MQKKSYLLECQGNPEATDAYLLEYQKNILRALKKEGLMSQYQLDECIARLGQNNMRIR